jgi:hypothetical protein
VLDVDDMFQVASVHKGYTVNGVLIAHCDEYVPYVDKGVQTEPSSPPNADGKEQPTKAVLTYSTIQSMESAQALFLPYPRTDPAPVLQRTHFYQDRPRVYTTVGPHECPRTPNRQRHNDFQLSSCPTAGDRSRYTRREAAYDSRQDRKTVHHEISQKLSS